MAHLGESTPKCASFAASGKAQKDASARTVPASALNFSNVCWGSSGGAKWPRICQDTCDVLMFVARNAIANICTTNRTAEIWRAQKCLGRVAWMGLAPFVNCYRACKLLSLSGSVSYNCCVYAALTQYKTFRLPMHSGHCMPFNIQPKPRVSIKLYVNTNCTDADTVREILYKLINKGNKFWECAIIWKLHSGQMRVMAWCLYRECSVFADYVVFMP